MIEAVLPRIPRWLLRVAAWLLAGAVVFVAVRRIDFDALGSALRGASWGWVALAAILNVVGTTVARDCLETFLSTAFEGGRHEQRVAKMS